MSTNNMAEEGEQVDWKQKCLEGEKRMVELGSLARKAVTDYEDLQKKYNDNQTQYEELKKVLKEREEQLEKLKLMLPAVCDEYHKLEREVQIAELCKDRAVQHAQEVEDKNKKLKRQSDAFKRQSAMLMSKVTMFDINIEEIGEVLKETEIEEEEESSNGVISVNDHLQKEIDGLTKELAEVKQKLSSAETGQQRAVDEALQVTRQNELQRQHIATLTSRVEEYDKQLTTLNRMSTLALDEYFHLAEKAKTEEALKAAAIKEASEIHAKNEALKRQTKVLRESDSLDERLLKASSEIEELTTQLAQEKTAHQQKVEELESIVNSSCDVEERKRLEQQIQHLTDQLEQMQKRIQDSDKWKEKLEKENRELVDKLDVAEQRLKPPPPPPLPPGGIFKQFKGFLTGKTKDQKPQLKKEIAKNDPQMQKALDEMMKKIRGGNLSLKPAGRRASLPEDPKGPGEPNAMEELQKFLSTSRNRSKSEGQVLYESNGTKTNTNSDASSELEKAFAKRREKSTKENGENKLTLIKETAEGASADV